ncbi:MAG: PEGA domain-containing protein, partial [Candidatus Zixiibacteriota bacterium]
PSPKGSIEVNVTSYGDIYVDDSLLEKGRSYASLTCDTGVHVIRVENRKSTVKKYQDTVTVKPGLIESRSYIFIIPPPPDASSQPRPSVPDSGRVAIGSRPRGADIYIDGQLMDHKTPYTFKVEAGRHVIRATSVYEGQVITKEDTIIVEVNKTKNISFRFDQ